MPLPLRPLSAHLATGPGAFDLLRGTAAEFAGSGWRREVSPRFNQARRLEPDLMVS